MTFFYGDEVDGAWTRLLSAGVWTEGGRGRRMID
jgi:hypothetical protein